MYFLLHPVSSLNHLVARLITDQITFLISIIFFIYLAQNYKKNYWAKLDEKIALFPQTSTNDFIKSQSNNFAIFGNAIFHISFCIIFSLVLIFTKHKMSDVIAILFTLIFSWGLNRLLKLIFKRERPENNAEDTKKRLSYCFPSGHVMASISIYFFISVLLQSFISFIPWYLISLLICYFIIMSRIYLNHHFFTDILSGICGGIVALNISIWFYFILGIV